MLPKKIEEKIIQHVTILKAAMVADKSSNPWWLKWSEKNASPEILRFLQTRIPFGDAE